MVRAVPSDESAAVSDALDCSGASLLDAGESVLDGAFPEPPHPHNMETARSPAASTAKFFFIIQPPLVCCLFYGAEL